MAQRFEDTKTVLTSVVNDDKSSNSQNSENSSNDEQLQTTDAENQDTSGCNGITNVDNVESIDQSDSNDTVKSFTSKLTAGNLQDKIKNFLRTEIKQPIEKLMESDAASKINSEYYLDDEYTEHYLPQQVDTSDVVGEMVQVNEIQFQVQF